MQNGKTGKDAFSFGQAIRALYTPPQDTSPQESLGGLEYDEELSLKNRAFAEFLQQNGVQLKPEPTIASPRPRHYRTTTKRRVYCDRQGISLGFAQPPKPGTCAESILEPEEHQAIYQWLLKTLSEKSFFQLARSLNWVIIRGGYERWFLILNIFEMDGKIVRKLKQLSALLEREKIVQGAMSYFDPSRSEYYLEAERPAQGLQVKHLFGSRLLGLKVDDILMRYSPTVFSQVNESIVPVMIDQARTLLVPQPEDSLLDLYCGYGLFCHTMGRGCKTVTGIELSKDAIDSAREIAKRLNPRARMRFIPAKIDSSLVRSKLAGPEQPELILLDPSRNGCEPGVIEQLAKRNPKRILHIFCATDEIPRGLKEWQEAGYTAKVIQPIDMFAGTPNLETMILLQQRS